MPAKNVERIVFYDEPEWVKRLDAAAAADGIERRQFIRRELHKAIEAAEAHDAQR